MRSGPLYWKHLQDAAYSTLRRAAAPSRCPVVKLLLKAVSDAKSPSLARPATYASLLTCLLPLACRALDAPEANDRIVADLAGLPHLRSLYLRADDVTDAGLTHLADARALRSLYLDVHQPTDAGLAQIATGLTELIDLGICLSETTDAGIASLTGLTGLHVLTITAPAGIREVVGLPQLSGLNLYNTPVDDDTVDSLAALTTLTSLSVSGDGVEVSDASYLRLRSVLPTITINGAWLAPQAVQHALGSVG